jgi:hypothetical protein
MDIPRAEMRDEEFEGGSDSDSVLHRLMLVVTDVSLHRLTFFCSSFLPSWFGSEIRCMQVATEEVGTVLFGPTHLHDKSNTRHDPSDFTSTSQQHISTAHIDNMQDPEKGRSPSFYADLEKSVLQHDDIKTKTQTAEPPVHLCRITVVQFCVYQSAAVMLQSVRDVTRPRKNEAPASTMMVLAMYWAWVAWMIAALLNRPTTRIWIYSVLLTVTLYWASGAAVQTLESWALNDLKTQANVLEVASWTTFQALATHGAITWFLISEVEFWRAVLFPTALEYPTYPDLSPWEKVPSPVARA